MTEVPDQPCVSIAVSSGKIAASVLPPAVGARSSASAPSSTGPTAWSCSARSDCQPKVLTMWCTTTGCSRSSAELMTTPGSWQVEVDVVGAGRGRHRQGGCVAFHLGQLTRGQGQRVMAARVEVGELVHPVQDIGDELLQEHPGRDPDLPAQRPGHRVRELTHVGVVYDLDDPVWLGG